MKSDARLDGFDVLTRRGLGGVATLGPAVSRTRKLEVAYRKSIDALRQFAFWRAGEDGTYRPARGLWLPQRKAVALTQAYLCAQGLADREPGDAREAALIKMPTGTGKSGVIATIACGSPLVKKTLILTPRAALVRQLARDLSYRFWRHLKSGYHDGRIHEPQSAEQIAWLIDQVESGSLTPIRLLNAEHYRKIWEERHQHRQIIVGTFNALHLILGITPPPHRSMYGRTVREPARSITSLDDESDDALAIGDPAPFRDFLKSFDLVIVDEGHYEPAYSWSQTVKAIGAPTLIVTATPYRNDYKYFNIKGNFVFNLPWQEAVEQKLIRTVVVESARTRPGSPPVRKAGRYSARDFVREFQYTLDRLPPGTKVIVHGATFTRLKRLQVAFYKICEGERAILIHDRARNNPGANDDLGKESSHMYRTLAPLRFQHVKQTEGDQDVDEARIWLHQYKLLEGIDESRFTEVWLCDAFGSARQLVQQVGRAIRLPAPDDDERQTATIRGSGQRLEKFEGAPTVAEQLARRWDAYLEYEEYASRKSETVFTAETQLVAILKRTAPEVQYVLGEFRAGHLLDEQPRMDAFLLPRRATICRVDAKEGPLQATERDSLLDRIQAQSSEAMQLEERFDIRVVAPPPGDRRFENCRLIRYLAWNTSPYLQQHHLPEWRMGVMAIVAAGRYIFLLDTEGNCVDTARLGLVSPEPQELKRLFPRNGRRASPMPTRIVETSAAGLDISELGVRSITLRKHALDEGYFDIAEASQVPTTVRGFGRLADRATRRRLSISRGSVADPTNQHVRMHDYIEWAGDVAAIMMDDDIKPHGYFRRFATEVRPLKGAEAVPKSVLLDLWDLLDPSGEQDEERRWNRAAVNEILGYDTCCRVNAVFEDDTRPPRYFFRFGEFDVEIFYSFKDTVPPSGRYSISCDALNDFITTDETDRDEELNDVADETAFGRQLSVSLTRLINQEQACTVVPAKPGVVYSRSHFFKPDINESLLSILEDCQAMNDVVSEKGETRLTDKADWARATQFGLVHAWAAQSPSSLRGIARDIAKCSLIVCDDGQSEAVDFFGLDEQARRVYFIHAKAEEGPPHVSARKLQTVARQAQASLAFAGSSRREFQFPVSWNAPWSVILKDARRGKVAKPRLFKRASKATTAADAHRLLKDALLDPDYAREVVVLTAGLLSKSEAIAAIKKGDEMTQDEVQFIYFLSSVRTTFDRAGVRLRVVTNP